jgi:alkylhydroperoxidase family enzyme
MRSSRRRVGDEAFGRLREQFDDRQIVELLLAIGEYLMLARVMTVLEIDLDEAAGDGVLRGVDAARDGT